MNSFVYYVQYFNYDIRDEPNAELKEINMQYISTTILTIIAYTSALRLLALRGLRTLRVRTRAFGPRYGGKLPQIPQFDESSTFKS